ncbi:MAG TPA: hypothetical protein VE934_12080 [Polaromonas sp.]|uniref:hypothetical protein n=1 Tax=Polaromonas sp. TaxID=1869339 RepID=UPI002D55ABD5|nr:hypothetical protein [Polaromonas sp.]HYW57694.1 hypothetical protein [Polaromonas sp.]
MDTSKTDKPKTEEGDKVELVIAAIKTQMPETYKSIQRKAASIGRQAYQLVRRGIAGEVNCFYAFEGGRVVGTPFNCPTITADIAMYACEFGRVHVCIFGEQLQPGFTWSNHGQN